MDKERYRNPPAPLGYQNQNHPDIVRRTSDIEEIQIDFQEWIALGIFEDDIAVYEHFVINSDSEDDEKGEIKTENKTKDVENTEQKTELNREKGVIITEKRTEKKTLDEDDAKRKEVTEKKTKLQIEAVKAKSSQLITNKKPQYKAVEDVIKIRTDECKDKFSAKHRKKKAKREHTGNKHKKIKQEIVACESNKSSQKKRRLLTRDDDSETEEEGRHRRKVKKYHFPSPTDDYYEEHYQKDCDNVKKEYDDCMYPATSIKQEFPSLHGVYHCDICNLTLNGDTTYQSHINGKKHKKKLDAKNVAQVVAKSYVLSTPPSKCPNYNGTCGSANILPITSSQDHSFKIPSTSSGHQLVLTAELFKSCSRPDPSKAGFYCNICNSHSNSSAMWEAHITGKRHIANLKKAPGTAPSKSRNVPAPHGTVARLFSQLKGVYEPIVGLDQIREIQRLDNDSVSYTCFLCGGNSISEDEIVDHILWTKHREKYLEKITYPDLDTFRSCQMSVRCSVIAELCKSIEDEQGRGEPEVYYVKNSLVRI